jgi:sugar lactone lactonase YvrE
MATSSFTSVRRFAGIAITLLFCLCLSGKGVGQGAAPLVTASSATGLSHPTGWGAIQQSAIDKDGDWLVVDYANGAVYEFPAGGGAAIVIAGPKGLGGGYQNPGIAIDPGNNLYLEANWNNCIVVFPWDPVAKAWKGLSALSPDNPTTSMCTNSGTGNTANAFAQYGLSADGTTGFPGWFQPWCLAVGNNNNLIVGTQTNGQFIFSLPVTSWTDPKPATITWEPITGLKKRPISVAQDQAGNIYFVEDSGGLPGVYEVPASTTTQLTADTGLTRVDPNLPSVTGVITDSKGNLYISDSRVGIVMVPNTTGVPDTANAVIITAVPSQGEAAIDWARNTMYVPTNQKQTNGQADVAKINFGFAELGASEVKKTAPGGTNVVFGFNGSATISRFMIVQDGAATPDFAITGGTCSTGTAYAAQSSCLETISFTPSAVGSVSAKLLMQKADPVAEGASDFRDVVSSYSGSGNILTLTAANHLVPGQLIQIAVPQTDPPSPLASLDQQYFDVLPSGLSLSQFQIQAKLPSSVKSAGTAVAEVKGFVYTTISSVILHGVGVGANILATPAQVSSMGTGLATPSQVAVDRQGNVYVADPGQGKVLMFPAGSGSSSQPSAVGNSLKAPTGIAVDGAGDIFIADTDQGVGSIYEIPYMTSGLNSESTQITLATGLGPNPKLAFDNIGNLYAADPAEGRVVKLGNIGGSGPLMLGQSETMLTAGFTAPSAVAVDHSGNLYVIDGANLFEISAADGSSTTLLNNLSGASGLAIDPSGAVYITSTAGTTRIPFVGGTLDTANQTAIASDVPGTAAVALDHVGNIYLVKSAGGGITVVGSNGTLTLATPVDLTSSTSSVATITNAGNAPLLVSGYTNSSSVIDTVTIADFTAADGTCVDQSTSPGTGIPAGGTCVVSVTFNPKAGEEGALTGWVGITSNAVNSPIRVATAAEGLALAGTGAHVSATGAAEVINTVLTVSVAANVQGGPVPTGTVALTFPSWTVVVKAEGPTINPVPITIPAVLDENGKATFQIAPVLAGAQTFTLGYVGDRVYGRSTATVNTVVAKSSISAIKLPALPDPSDVSLPFVIADNGAGTTPYDGSVKPWQYQFIMNVNTAFGVPTGGLNIMDDSTKCPPGTSPGGLGTAACVLANYSGPACPQKAAAAALTIQNAGTPTGAQASFDTGCLWAVPQGTTYSPVLYTHYIHPEYSGDANFLPFKGESTLFQAVRGPIVQITQTGNAASATTVPTLSVTAGSSASIDLTITSLLGYGFAGKGGQLNNSNYPVSLTCDIPIPHAQCAVIYDNSVVDPNQITAPNSVQIPCPANVLNTQLADGSVSCTPGHARVTFYTDVTTGTTTAQNARVAAVTLAGIFGFGMIGLFFRRRSFEKARMMMMVVMMVVGIGLAVSLTACSTTNLNPQTILKSPAGTYNATITAREIGTQCIAAQGDPNSNCTTITGGTGRLVYGSSNQVSLPFYVTVTVQ